MKICVLYRKISQSRFKTLPNIKLTLKTCQRLLTFDQIWSHWQPICFLNMPFPLFLRIMQPSFCCKSRQNQNLNNLIFETIYNCRWYQLFRLWAFAYRGMIEMYQITFANVCPWKFYLDWRLLRIKQHLDIPSVVGFLDLDRCIWKMSFKATSSLGELSLFVG